MIPVPAVAADLQWFPVVKKWRLCSEYQYASFTSRMIVDAALAVFMEQGRLPVDPEALRNAIGAAGWKDYPKAYEGAKAALDLLLPLWEAELLKSLAFVDKQRANGGKGGRPSKPKPEPKKKPKVNPAETHGLPTGSPTVNPNKTTVTVTNTDNPSGEGLSSVAEATGEVVPSQAPTPYQLIEFVFWQRAVRLATLSGESVDVEKLRPESQIVTKHLRGTTGLLPLIHKIGPYETVDVLIWVARKMPAGTTSMRIFEQIDVIKSQMTMGQDWVTRNRVAEGSPNLRGHLEVDLF